MIKTQVQIPEELYHKAKQIAKEREWSFAEVMRRGLEYMAQACPPAPDKDIRLPILHGVEFADNIDELDLKAIVQEEEEMRSLRHVEL